MSFGVGIGDMIAVIKLINNVRERFADSPAEFKALSDEVMSLSKVLHDIRGLFSEPDFTAQQKTDLEQHLIACESLLADLDKVLDKYHELEGPKPTGIAKRSRSLWKRVSWEPDDIARLRDRLATNVGTLNAFTNRIILALSRATKTNVEHLRKYQDEQKHREILDWLSSTNFPAYQADILRGCQEATGQWFVNSRQFRLWLDGRELTLFCPGIPGAGKTMITSIVIDNLQTRFTNDPKVAVTFLYFNYKRPAEQTVENLLASLLKQLLYTRADLPVKIQNLHQYHSLKGTRPTVAELSNALKVAIRDTFKTFVLLDALDECVDRSVVKRLLNEIYSLQEHDSINLFATSRSIPEITIQFHKIPTLEICAKDEDMCLFLKNQMTSLPSSIQRKSELRDTVIKHVVTAADGMFLLARLHLESLSDKMTVKAVKEALKALPKGSEALSLAYDDALERIKSQKPGFESMARKAISWLVYAKRELTRQELCYALAIEDGSSEFDEENLAEADEIIGTCAGLVTLDRNANIIRLVHHTAQQYFETLLPHWAPLAQEEITRTCLTFLSFESIKSGWTSTSVHNYDLDYRLYMRNRYQEQCFLKYAAYHWISHARECWNKTIENLVLEWLGDEERIASCFEVFANLMVSKDYILLPIKPSALHISALFGLETLGVRLLDQGYSPNVRDGCKNTPLSYLSYPHPSVTDSDKEATTKLLLEQNDIDVNAKNTNGETPLYAAAHFGSEAVATMLLDHDKIRINHNLAESTPLMEAAKGGHESIVRKLLDRDEIQVNLQDRSGFTALHLADSIPYELLRLLLQRDDIQINIQDAKGYTALHWAASLHTDDTGFGSMLLERDEIQVNCEGHKKKTALALAARYGNKDLVSLLLQREDVQVNSRCSRNRTSLMLAAKNGHADVVSILLQNKDVQIDCRDEKGQTAIMLAYKRGHEEVVTQLEQAGARGEIPEPDERIYNRRHSSDHSSYEWFDDTSCDEESSDEESSDEEVQG